MLLKSKENDLVIMDALLPFDPSDASRKYLAYLTNDEDASHPGEFEGEWIDSPSGGQRSAEGGA